MWVQTWMFGGIGKGGSSHRPCSEGRNSTPRTRIFRLQPPRMRTYARALEENPTNPCWCLRVGFQVQAKRLLCTECTDVVCVSACLVSAGRFGGGGTRDTTTEAHS